MKVGTPDALLVNMSRFFHFLVIISKVTPPLPSLPVSAWELHWTKQRKHVLPLLSLTRLLGFVQMDAFGIQSLGWLVSFVETPEGGEPIL